MRIACMRTVCRRFAGLLMVAGVMSTAWAQSGDKVSQYSNLNLAAFGAGSGNDCWGYVSPSGREYAIMGLNNQVAFVEITNPASPVIIEQIPHSSSTWGDIKVWGHYAYAVTEANNTGVQVIDMSDIDNGNVTLVKTITNPGRSHNVVLDTDNGFLYTVGSNQSSGTTMCFTLADPANPVKVGANSMTQNYIHDAQVMTWTSGNLAGRQLFFGCSEGRGVDIYDMTNKSAPVLVKRVVYPNMSYCHQAWVSDDRRFLFVDDELDEGNLLVPTRSLMFNIEDPENAYFVGTFTTGLLAIDHNQYVSDGFSFQANYRSGLRIFDVSQMPSVPVEVGYYDTYPADNNRGYDGAWSCYPFFPSGNVIISDINRGLFVVDATEATTRKRPAGNFTVVKGQIVSGGLGDTELSGGGSLRISAGANANDRSPVEVEFECSAYDESPLKLKIGSRSSSSIYGFKQVISLYDWTTNSWEPIDTQGITPAMNDTIVAVNGPVSRFVQPGTKTIKLRMRYEVTAGLARGLLVVSLDQLQFQITR
ncbi:MAG: choice-of-anchor B family protein [Fimbriimonadaceae bacterium]|nr:MAG: choice-of-anchor B family protein [Fimbriimonadaceae bacterium]